MKSVFFLFIILGIIQGIKAQNVGIGTTTPNSNAALEISSNSKGLLLPRLSNAAKKSMSNVAKGMMVYDTTYSSFHYHDGNKWRQVGDKNFDGLLTDYSSSPVVTANMSSNSGTTALSGILYDNGGPAGNYAASSNNLYSVNRSATATDSMVGFKVIIEEMNLESPYDSIEIYSDINTKSVFTGTTTGTYFFPGSGTLQFRFRSNAVNQLYGFKIVWSVLVASNSLAEEPPLYGWHFNTRKLSMRGGLRNANEWATDSLGKFSFAYGYDAKASGLSAVSFMNGKATGDYSVAIGSGTYATGNSSFSIGYGGFFSNTASANGAIAIGGGNTASGANSMAFGLVNSPSGLSATTIGYGNAATADYSVALGNSNESTGDYALAMGSNTIASGDYATTTGRNTIASGVSSTAMGNSTLASGSYSTAIGQDLTSRGYAGIVVGMYNDPILGVTGQTSPTSSTPLFIVGNGDDDNNRSNAMVVLKSGYTGIGTDVPLSNLHIKHAGGGGLMLENASDNNKWRIYSASGDNNLTFYNNAGNEVADIDDVTGTFSALSDSRYKKNIQSMAPVLSLLMKLKPSYYQFNWQQLNEQRQIGLLAQEAYQLFPELVSYSKEKDVYKMNYAGFSTVTIKAIQEQQVIIENLQQQIDELKTLVNQLLKSK